MSGELGPFGVRGPGVGRGRGWRSPRRVRGDDLEAIANGQAAIRLGVVRDHHLNDRRLAARAPNEPFEVRT